MDASPLLTVQEVAALWRCSDSSVYRAIESGRVRAARIHRLWRVSRVDAERMAVPDATAQSPGTPVSGGGDATAVARSQVAAVDTPALPPGPGYPIFRHRPWETGTEKGALSG